MVSPLNMIRGGATGLCRRDGAASETLRREGFAPRAPGRAAASLLENNVVPEGLPSSRSSNAIPARKSVQVGRPDRRLDRSGRRRSGISDFVDPTLDGIF